MKHWVLAFVAGLLIGVIGTAVAAPRSGRRVGVPLPPNQSGIFLWSSDTQRYYPLDKLVQSLQIGHNNLVGRVERLERVTNIRRN